MTDDQIAAAIRKEIAEYRKTEEYRLRYDQQLEAAAKWRERQNGKRST